MIKKGNPQEIPQNSRTSFIISDLFNKKECLHFCLLVDDKVVLRWAVHYAKWAAAKLQKGTLAEKFQGQPILNLEILCIMEGPRGFYVRFGPIKFLNIFYS